MGLLVRVKSTITRVADTGRSKAADMRRGRDRSRLLRELGDARYAQSKGVTTSDAEMERIIAEIDALDAPADNDSPSAPNDDASGTDAVGDEHD